MIFLPRYYFDHCTVVLAWRNRVRDFDMFLKTLKALHTSVKTLAP